VISATCSRCGLPERHQGRVLTADEIARAREHRRLEERHLFYRTGGKRTDRRD
jgi:hypothetical protein